MRVDILFRNHVTGGKADRLDNEQPDLDAKLRLLSTLLMWTGQGQGKNLVSQLC